MQKKINTALISVFNKEGLLPILEQLKKLNVSIISSGGTHTYITENGFECTKVDDVTQFPEILGGRVKTLHPKIFGGILRRNSVDSDLKELERHDIPQIDLVIVDLYPFEETLKNTTDEQELIEKIDIGGISLIRASAKNFKEVLIVSRQNQYNSLLNLLQNQDGFTDEQTRKEFAQEAFKVSSSYDSLIGKWLSSEITPLRYGENPHQKAFFDGKLSDNLTKLNGKELSYNNLVDIDAGLGLLAELPNNSCVVIKHTNPCGCAVGDTLLDAWLKAYQADTVSAFGGILCFNSTIDFELASELDKLFFEIVLAKDFTDDAYKILSSKKNRIILKINSFNFSNMTQKTILNGVLYQDRDTINVDRDNLKFPTELKPTDIEISQLEFANVVCKHAKSNTIVITQGYQLIGIGVGQTSRIDALQQAIDKAIKFGFSLNNACMASDAFFPFNDCVALANQNGINKVIHPGGSIRDDDSIKYCNEHKMKMIITGFRHFKH